jgi:hypothetical protein
LVLIARDPGGYLSGLYWFRTGEVGRWISWFSNVVESSTTAAFAWAGEVDALIAGWQARVSDLRRDSAVHTILASLPSFPVITAATASAAIGVSDTAARLALETLEARGIVERIEVATTTAGRPRRWWIARELTELIRI